MAEIKDYRLTVKLRNNRLLSRIEGRGFASIAAFCRYNGLTYTAVNALITMAEPPVTSKGEWRLVAERLASILRCTPADLFTERQIRGEIAATTVARQVNEDELVYLDAPDTQLLLSPSPEQLLENTELVDKLLARLSEQDQRLIRMHYGIGEPRQTLDHIGEVIGRSKERVRQMISTAERRMRRAAVRHLHVMSVDHPLFQKDLEDLRHGRISGY
jgi:RNA polymerase sigma factor (sigma-70 family)